MLVPAGPDARGPGVVTDFGLARAVGGLDLGAVTATARILGTPAYMAPEQIEGKPVTAAADIYALGIVIYEMVTGQRPFTGANSLAVAVQRLTEPPPSPRVHVARPGPAPGRQAILAACGAIPPSASPPPKTWSRALRGEPLVHHASARARGAGKRRRLVVAGGGAPGPGAAWAIARSGPRARRRRPPGAGAARDAPARPRPAVAVLGFKDLGRTQDDAWLSARALRDDGERAGRRREHPRRHRRERGPDEAGPRPRRTPTTWRPDRLSRVGAHLGADRVVVGLLPRPRSGDRLGGCGWTCGCSPRPTERPSPPSARRARRRSCSTSSRGPGHGCARAWGRASSRRPTGARAASIGPVQPRRRARAYAEGLARLRVFDAVRARPLLEAAVRADPAHPLFHAALAEAWSALGYDAVARSEAQDGLRARLRAVSRGAAGRRGALPRDDQGMGPRGGDPPQPVELLPRQPGVRPAPGRSRGAGRQAEGGAGYRGRPFAGCPRPTGRIRASISPRRPSPTGSPTSRGSGPRPSGRPRRRKRAARGCWWPRRGWSAADAAWALGEPDRALDLHGEAKAIFDAAGDRSGVARALTGMANVHYRRGRLAEAKQLYERGLAVYRETGNEFAVAWTLHSVANVLSDRGDLTGSRRLQEQALAIHRRIGDRGGEAGSLGNLASLLQYQGDFAGARRMHEQALAIFREVGREGARRDRAEQPRHRAGRAGRPGGRARAARRGAGSQARDGQPQLDRLHARRAGRPGHRSRRPRGGAEASRGGRAHRGRRWHRRPGPPRAGSRSRT